MAEQLVASRAVLSYTPTTAKQQRAWFAYTLWAKESHSHSEHTSQYKANKANCLRFSRQWRWRMASSGMLRRVALVRSTRRNIPEDAILVKRLIMKFPPFPYFALFTIAHKAPQNERWRSCKRYMLTVRYNFMCSVYMFVFLDRRNENDCTW
jgi:hypothetical protein